MLDSDTSPPGALPRRTLGLSVAGRNLRPFTLGDQLGADATLLVFLPDLQVPDTRAVVGDLHLATDLWGDLTPTIFVHARDVEAGDALFHRLHPGARAVADPGRRLFEAFGLASRRAPRFSVPRFSVPRFSVRRVPSRRPGAPWGRGAGRLPRDLPSVPTLVHLDGTTVTWTEPYGVAGARPELDRILRLANVVARARGAGRAA